MVQVSSVIRLVHRIRHSRKKSHRHRGLQVVASPDNAVVDIIAVHGLKGDGFASWTTSDPDSDDEKVDQQTKPWLSELLAPDVPAARIITFSFRSDYQDPALLMQTVLFGEAFGLVRGIAALRRRDGTCRRPIIFLAHSLGGLIVKSALVLSSDSVEVEMKDVELSTCGLVFFGTPSSGLSRPSAPELATVIRRASELSASSSSSSSSDAGGAAATFSAEPMLRDVEWLERKMEAFKAIVPQLPVVSFYETRQTQGGFVVDRRQSLGNDKIRIALDASHDELVKFHGRSDRNYTVFLEQFSSLLDGTGKYPLANKKWAAYDKSRKLNLDYVALDFRIPSQTPSDAVPFPIAQRPSLLRQLSDVLQPSMADGSPEFRIALLHGPPGIGKTTLARHFAETNPCISFVIWIAAESRETVIGSYLTLANAIVTHYVALSSESPPSSTLRSRAQVEEDLGLRGVGDMLNVKTTRDLDSFSVEAVVKSVNHWLLRPGNDQWLLIFDNVEPTYNILDFLPLTLSRRIILTARNKECVPLGTKVAVPTMDTEEAVGVLQSVVGEEALLNETQVSAARTIVALLDYHPHDISLAGYVILQQGLSLEQYVRYLRGDTPTKVFGSTIDQSPVARGLLRISSMLSSSSIPVDLFALASGIQNIPSRFSRVAGDLYSLRNTKHLQQALAFLVEQDFIRPDSPSASSDSSLESYFVEPSAREYIRQSLTLAEREEVAWAACNSCIASLRQKEADSSTLSEIQGYGRVMVPHAKGCYDEWATILESGDGATGEDSIIAWQVLGDVCMTQGAVGQAIGCFSLALKHGSSLKPEERTEIQLSLAALLARECRLDECEGVLESIDMLVASPDLRTKITLAKAETAILKGDLEKARGHYDGLEIDLEERLGALDLNTVSTVQRLALTLLELGETENSQALFRRVYLSYKNLVGTCYPLTLDALDQLALASQVNGGILTTKALYEQSIAVKERVLGAKHPCTADSMTRLANMYDLRGQYDAAEKTYKAALDIMTPTLGSGHPLCLMTMESMALGLRSKGLSLEEGDRGRARAFAEAEKMYREVLRLKKSMKDLYGETDIHATEELLGGMYAEMSGGRRGIASIGVQGC